MPPGEPGPTRARAAEAQSRTLRALRPWWQVLTPVVAAFSAPADEWHIDVHRHAEEPAPPQRWSRTRHALRRVGFATTMPGVDTTVVEQRSGTTALDDAVGP